MLDISLDADAGLLTVVQVSRTTFILVGTGSLHTSRLQSQIKLGERVSQIVLGEPWSTVAFT